ncbi:MAG: ATP-dependent DNA helicase, partial [Solirubrobacteraceae bacterium]
MVEVVRAAEAKLVLVGDPHQLGAVGPGGLFRTLVDDHGAHELETVRRFANAWEAAASLRLRARDPSILPTYLAKDRLAEGSRAAMVEDALLAWRAGRAAGEDVLVMTGDNESAAELARRCRAELVAAGVVEADGVRIASGLAGIGDEVVTLRNDRRLRPSPSEFVRNGARWRVTDRGEDGSLTVVPLAGEGTVTLPSEYVAEHVGLAYALTVHKAQGTTSDRAVVLVDEAMTAAQLYVGMSRGRQENRALVVTNDADADEHARRPGLSGMELLIQVMRRQDGDVTAHEVLRANLVRSEDRELLNGLRSVVKEHIEREAGPDLRGRIAALEQ